MSECPYCLTAVDGGAEIVRCETCGVAHHRECWESNGGCSSRTCGRNAPAVEVDVTTGARGRIVLSRESIESAPPRTGAFSNPCIRCGAQVPDGELYCLRCLPEPQESQDSRNLWPVMVMVGAMGAVLAWLIVAIVIGSSAGK